MTQCVSRHSPSEVMDLVHDHVKQEVKSELTYHGYQFGHQSQFSSRSAPTQYPTEGRVDEISHICSTARSKQRQFFCSQRSQVSKNEERDWLVENESEMNSFLPMP